MPIKECRAADVAAMSDRRSLGVSILVMRKWPRLRGFNRFSVDYWLPDLGPSLVLLEEYRKGSIDWTTFAEHYKAEQRAATSCRVVQYINGNRARNEREVVQRSPLVVLREIEEAHGTATVICWENTCECHRFLLVAMANEEVTV
jgi:uncharacterized protein YeaO (DUF488 family)